MNMCQDIRQEVQWVSLSDKRQYRQYFPYRPPDREKSLWNFVKPIGTTGNTWV